MSGRPPKFDATVLAAALGTRLPAGFTREDRVRLLGECFRALLDGKLPSRAAALFLGGAGLAWLREGGSLERDYFKVTKPKSHHTPAVLWERLNAHCDEREDGDDTL